MVIWLYAIWIAAAPGNPGPGLQRGKIGGKIEEKWMLRPKTLSLSQRQEVEEQGCDGEATGWCWAAGRESQQPKS